MAVPSALVCFYLALLVIRPGGMGLGDAKLAASVGAALAWISWHACSPAPLPRSLSPPSTAGHWGAGTRAEAQTTPHPGRPPLSARSSTPRP
ncbi:MAG: A24 family peptidase, partial [Streptosporangiaceae bacterium]